MFKGINRESKSECSRVIDSLLTFIRNGESLFNILNTKSFLKNKYIFCHMNNKKDIAELKKYPNNSYALLFLGYISEYNITFGTIQQCSNISYYKASAELGNVFAEAELIIKRDPYSITTSKVDTFNELKDLYSKHKIVYILFLMKSYVDSRSMSFDDHFFVYYNLFKNGREDNNPLFISKMIKFKEYKDRISELESQLLEESLRPPHLGGSEYQKGLQSALSNGFKA